VAPSLAVLGIFPTLQSIGAQIVMLIAIVVGFIRNRQRAAA